MFLTATVYGATAQTVRLPDHEAKCEILASAARMNPGTFFKLRNLPLAQDENVAIANDLLDFASGFMGVKYRRGGKTPSGFDCSGFTGYVFRQFGYSLGASSRDQYLDGEYVESESIKPGDLLFFSGRSRSTSRVGHVAIAVDSDPQTGIITFIHASCSEGISINRTSEPYYAARYIGARRVIGVE